MARALPFGTRERDESSDSRLRALFDTLIAATRVVATASDRSHLLSDTCAALVSHRAFATAWIGADEDGDGWVERLAVAGDGTGYTDGLRISVRDVPEGRGPTGTAIRLGAPWTSEDYGTDERMAPWRERVLAAGLRSGGAFPLHSRTVPSAVLTVHADVAGAFGRDEAELLDDLARSVGLALDSIASTEARAAAEAGARETASRVAEELARSEERLRLASSLASIGVFEDDLRIGDAYWSPVLRDIYGLGPEEPVVARQAFGYVHPDDRARVATELARAQESGSDATFGLEHRIVGRDGAVRWVATLGRTFFEGGSAVRTLGVTADVTERHAARERLEESEERFRTAFDATRDAISIQRAIRDETGAIEDFEILWANRAWREANSRGRDDIVGARVYELAPDVAARKGRHVRVVETGIGDRFRAAVAGRWVEVSLDRFRDGLLVVSRDVTDAVLTESAIRDSEERYRSLIDELDAVVTIQDYETGSYFVSPQAEAVFGYPTAKLAEPGFWRGLVVPEDRDRVVAVWDDDAHLDAYQLEYRVRRADGRIAWLDERMRSMKDASGRAFRWYGVALDVTAHREAQAAAEASRAAFASLFEHAPLVNLIVRLVRDDRRRIVDWEIVELNSAAAALLGTIGGSGRSALGGLASEVIGPSIEPFTEAARDVEETGRPRIIEWELDGRMYQTVVFFLGDDLCAGLAQDVTDLRRAQAAYERAERMDALAQLAAGVAHDFKNILWGIDLIGQALATAHEPPDPVAGDAALIAEAVNHGTALTRQLMEFARPRIPTAGALDIDEALVAVEAMLLRLLGEPHRLVVRRGAPGAVVHLDRRQFENVLINLVMNARDAMREAGTMTIASERTILDPADARANGVGPGRYASVTVSDTGSGIAPAILEHIFEPYFTTKGGEKGTGLGLATTFGIVSAAGGAVSAESEVGRGTTFRILLPLADEDGAREPA